MYFFAMIFVCTKGKKVCYIPKVGIDVRSTFFEQVTNLTFYMSRLILDYVCVLYSKILTYKIINNIKLPETRQDYFLKCNIRLSVYLYIFQYVASKLPQFAALID